MTNQPSSLGEYTSVFSFWVSEKIPKSLLEILDVFKWGLRCPCRIYCACHLLNSDRFVQSNQGSLLWRKLCPVEAGMCIKYGAQSAIDPHNSISVT